jgi:hypothetical protein
MFRTFPYSPLELQFEMAYYICVLRGISGASFPAQSLLTED